MSSQPKQNLLSLMRRLRPMLPGKVKKIDKYSYSVENKCAILLNYFCTWKAGQTDEKSCHPSSITVKVYEYGVRELTKERYSVVPSSIFRTRTISKRADGDFSLESVATAVTKCIETVDQWLKDKKDSEKKEKVKKTKLEECVKALETILPKNAMQEHRWASNRFAWNDGNMQVEARVDLNDDMQDSYEITIEQLTLDQLRALLDYIDSVKLVKSLPSTMSSSLTINTTAS